MAIVVRVGALVARGRAALPSFRKRLRVIGARQTVDRDGVCGLFSRAARTADAVGQQRRRDDNLGLHFMTCPSPSASA